MCKRGQVHFYTSPHAGECKAVYTRGSGAFERVGGGVHGGARGNDVVQQQDPHTTNRSDHLVLPS